MIDEIALIHTRPYIETVQRDIAARRTELFTYLMTSFDAAELPALAELLGAPVYQQSVPDAAHFPSDHPAYMGTLSRDQKKVAGS